MANFANVQYVKVDFTCLLWLGYLDMKNLHRNSILPEKLCNIIGLSAKKSFRRIKLDCIGNRKTFSS